ncbi:DEAD-box ATP-dependent RNA helicase 52B [Dissostichus eleginoides]|nr:DEAD-box ATP-dependent RNA helicase 52B [Dissostichus eleginoides]
MDSPLGRAAPEAESSACHPNHRPPPLSIISRPAFSLLSVLSFSWAPELGLWPVDECYILAVSTGVSWGLACGGSAVSGPVCQLLVLLPPAPPRRLQSVAQTYAEL